MCAVAGLERGGGYGFQPCQNTQDPLRAPCARRLERTAREIKTEFKSGIDIGGGNATVGHKRCRLICKQGLDPQHDIGRIRRCRTGALGIEKALSGLTP